MRYLILAQAEATARALGAWLELLGEPPLSGDCDPRVIIWAGHHHLDVAQAYDLLSETIAVAAAGQSSGRAEVTLLVDHVRWTGLNVVTEGSSWGSLVAMLVLAFPEFRWVFGGVGIEPSKASQDRKEFHAQHALPALFSAHGSNPLFDPHGLRELVRRQTNAYLRSPLREDLRLPSRRNNQRAAIIDEERAYVYFNGYCAYRFGFRSDLIDTWAKMKRRFGKDAPSPHPYWLLLEDMSLNFPDREKNVHLHGLNTERASGECCPRLDSKNPGMEGSKYRILITTGQTRPGDNTLVKNRSYLREKKCGRGAVVLKPACGMFDLWDQAGLMRRHYPNRHPGFAPSFSWPPAAPSSSKKQNGGHGAPGKLLLVAEKLIERAEAIKPQVRSVSDAVLGATLATDALELTGGRTPTTAIEALSLKHQFEVMAECQFSGVEHHIRIAPRIAEIKNELTAICRWFGSQKRESAKLNAEMHILNELVRILRGYNQFDEEQACMREVRRLHSTLWMKAHSWRKLFWLPIRYVEWLLSSFLGFVGTVGVWLLILTVLFSLIPGSEDQRLAATWGVGQLIIGAERAVTSFFSIGPPMQEGGQIIYQTKAYIMLSTFSMISGFLHLGVLVTHLYSLVSRK